MILMYGSSLAQAYVAHFDAINGVDDGQTSNATPLGIKRLHRFPLAFWTHLLIIFHLVGFYEPLLAESALRFVGSQILYRSKAPSDASIATTVLSYYALSGHPVAAYDIGGLLNAVGTCAQERVDELRRFSFGGEMARKGERASQNKRTKQDEGPKRARRSRTEEEEEDEEEEKEQEKEDMSSINGDVFGRSPRCSRKDDYGKTSPFSTNRNANPSHNHTNQSDPGSNDDDSRHSSSKSKWMKSMTEEEKAEMVAMAAADSIAMQISLTAVAAWQRKSHTEIDIGVSIRTLGELERSLNDIKAAVTATGED